MFKAIINGIFSVKKDLTIPDYEFYERTRKEKSEAEEQTKRKLIQQINSEPIQEVVKPEFSKKLEHDFYGYLFGESVNTSTKDPLSDHVSQQIKELLKAPAALLTEMPIMPASVSSALTSLNNQNFNINDVLAIILREPSMAADTIKLANSAKYQRNNKQVVDLKTAFMNIGSQGLINGVLYVFINKFTPNSKLYFKCFGNKIWQHCQQTADLSQSLAELSLSKEESSASYLIGLIRNLGIMVSFQLMIEAFSHIAPDATPSSMTFKKLMSSHSLTLTIAIAKHWQLPVVIVQAIEQQHWAQSMKSPLATCISEANVMSKILSLLKDKVIDEIQYKKYCHQYFHSETARNLALGYLP